MSHGEWIQITIQKFDHFHNVEDFHDHIQSLDPNEPHIWKHPPREKKKNPLLLKYPHQEQRRNKMEFIDMETPSKWEKTTFSSTHQKKGK